MGDAMYPAEEQPAMLVLSDSDEHSSSTELGLRSERAEAPLVTAMRRAHVHAAPQQVCAKPSEVPSTGGHWAMSYGL
jgi:hypothetical protein